MTRAEAVAFYASQGWHCIPIPSKEKRPNIPDWPELRLTAADSLFAGHGNLGVLLGEVSGGLVDLDLDCKEAIELAPRLLPATWVFGRRSKPASHWLYRVVGTIETRRMLDVPGENGKRETLLEVRSGGTPAKLQTVFPPSVHPSGEAVLWDSDEWAPRGAPRQVSAASLQLAARQLYKAVLISRHASKAAAEAFLAGGPWPTGMARERELRALLGIQVVASRPSVRSSDEGSAELEEAAQAYNRANARPLPRSGSGTCPMCGHHDCFGQRKDSETHWSCFSASHQGIGRKGAGDE